MLGRTLVLLSFLMAAIPGTAETLFFTGQVTGDAINGCGGLVNCGVVTGSYDFDPLTADLNPADPQTGLYAAANILFSIDGVPFFSGATGLINVGNDYAGPVDLYGLIASGTASNSSTGQFALFLQDSGGLSFNSDALPLDPHLLLGMLPGTFQLNAGDDSFQLQGTITTIATPEPAALSILALGLVLISIRKGKS